MESTTALPEFLPSLYRSILVLVGELERRDGRREASRIRKQALAAYATAWDDRQHRRLAQLEEELRRAISSRDESARRQLRLP
jgi:hypothetical protein